LAWDLGGAGWLDPANRPRRHALAADNEG
jgi:hypothetical protein